jgi:hypothetical protein
MQNSSSFNTAVILASFYRELPISCPLKMRRFVAVRSAPISSLDAGHQNMSHLQFSFR